MTLDIVAYYFVCCVKSLRDCSGTNDLCRLNWRLVLWRMWFFYFNSRKKSVKKYLAYCIGMLVYSWVSWGTQFTQLLVSIRYETHSLLLLFCNLWHLISAAFCIQGNKSLPF